MSDIFEKIMTTDFKVKTSGQPKKEKGIEGKSTETHSVYQAKSEKRSELLLENISKHGFNVSQMEKIFKTKGNQLILSGAGSGKTTSLIFLLLFNQTTGELTSTQEINGRTVRVLDNIFVSTFLKTGAEELQGRYKTWARKLDVPDMSDYITFSTLHAEFKNCLNRLGIDTNIITDKENKVLLKKVVGEIFQYSNQRFNAETLRDFETALTRSRNTISKDKRYESAFYEEFNISSIDVEAVLKGWRYERQKKGVMDFEDLQEVLYNLLYIKKDTIAWDFVQNRFDYMFIDEFQDTSEIQYLLLKAYTQGCKKVIAIGDDDQTIYSWRGSSADIITKRFEEDFVVTRNSLTINYRCPSVILNSIVPSIEKNQNRFEKNLESNREGGILRVGRFNSTIQMAKTLIKEVKQDIQQGKTVTILGRTNKDLFLPALMLAKDGSMRFSLSDSKMTFENSFGRTAQAIPYLLTHKSGLQVSTALKSLVWEKTEVDRLMKICKNEGVFFTELDNEDLEYSFPTLYKYLKEITKLIDGKTETQALELLYRYFIQDAQKGKGEYAINLQGVLSSIYEFVQEEGFATARGLTYELKELATDLKFRVSKDTTSDKVRLSTVHEYKGKETESVYIWNDSLEVFPHFRTENEDTFEEERRLHYIAATRASEKLTILTQRGREGLFMKEMDLSNAEELVQSVGGLTL